MLQWEVNGQFLNHTRNIFRHLQAMHGNHEERCKVQEDDDQCQRKMPSALNTFVTVTVIKRI